MMLLEMEPDRALFEGKLQGLVATFYENERPLRGLAGLLDWRFGGLISRALRTGALTGRTGECGYVPVSRNGRIYHLMLLGGGHLSRYARRGLVPDAALATLKRNLEGLKLPDIGLSRADFGGLTDDYLGRQLEGASFWIVP